MGNSLAVESCTREKNTASLMMMKSLEQWIHQKMLVESSWVIGIFVTLFLLWGSYLTRKIALIGNILNNSNLVEYLHKLTDSNRMLVLLLENISTDVKEVERRVEKLSDKINVA